MPGWDFIQPDCSQAQFFNVHIPERIPESYPCINTETKVKMLTKPLIEVLAFEYR